MKLQQFLKHTCNQTTYDVCWKIDRSLLEKLTFEDCHQESSMGWMHSNQLEAMHPKYFWKPGTPVLARYFHHATFAVRPWSVKVCFLKSFHAVWRSFLWLAQLGWRRGGFTQNLGFSDQFQGRTEVLHKTPRNFTFLNLPAQSFIPKKPKNAKKMCHLNWFRHIFSRWGGEGNCCGSCMGSQGCGGWRRDMQITANLFKIHLYAYI